MITKRCLLQAVVGSYAGVLLSVTVITYAILPMLFVGKIPHNAPELTARSTVVELLGVPEEELPFYVAFSVWLGQHRVLRCCLGAATALAILFASCFRKCRLVLLVLHQTLLWFMLFVLCAECIALTMCV